MADLSFTKRELDVMAVLWLRGSATVREVRERLKAELAYTTVLTLLRTLQAKGYVRYEREGRAHRYYPLIARDEAGSSALRQLVSKVFSGSPEALLTQFVSDHDLSEEDLRRIRRLLDKRLKGEGQR